MNEHTAQVDLTGKKADNRALTTCVLQTANLLAVPSSEPHSQRFAGRSVANESPVLVTLEGPPPSLRLRINCESMTIGSMLLKELKEAIGRSFWTVSSRTILFSVSLLFFLNSLASLLSSCWPHSSIVPIVLHEIISLSSVPRPAAVLVISYRAISFLDRFLSTNGRE